MRRVRARNTHVLLLLRQLLVGLLALLLLGGVGGHEVVALRVHCSDALALLLQVDCRRGRLAALRVLRGRAAALSQVGAQVQGNLVVSVLVKDPRHKGVHHGVGLGRVVLLANLDALVLAHGQGGVLLHLLGQLIAVLGEVIKRLRHVQEHLAAPAHGHVLPLLGRSCKRIEGRCACRGECEGDARAGKIRRQ